MHFTFVFVQSLACDPAGSRKHQQAHMGLEFPPTGDLKMLHKKESKMREIEKTRSRNYCTVSGHRNSQGLEIMASRFPRIGTREK
jgi:hypothetical protein